MLQQEQVIINVEGPEQPPQESDDVVIKQVARLLIPKSGNEMSSDEESEEPDSPSSSVSSQVTELTKELNDRILDLLHSKEARLMFYEEVQERRHY